MKEYLLAITDDDISRGEHIVLCTRSILNVDRLRKLPLLRTPRCQPQALGRYLVGHTVGRQFNFVSSGVRPFLSSLHQGIHQEIHMRTCAQSLDGGARSRASRSLSAERASSQTVSSGQGEYFIPDSWHRGRWPAHRTYIDMFFRAAS